MAIEDPTAIPETAAAADEYMREAGEAWNRTDTERARPLYHAAIVSAMLESSEHSLASFRLATILLADGDRDTAYAFATISSEPGAADIVRAIDGSTPDGVIDPSEVPQTIEEIDRYFTAAQDASSHGESATEEALQRAIANSPASSPGMVANAALRVGQLAHADGRDEEARGWAQSALANASADADRDGALTLLREMGVHVEDSNPIETEGSRRLIAGMEAWERGEQATAQTEFQAVLAADDVTFVDKGRAAFYLGSMAYHARDFDTARTYLHQARDAANDPEQSWAAEMLEWRWQEQES